ncbi:3-ketoacyl-ACP reductase [Luteitalea sp. TBR-22]|uniref:3-ketoacyl-ACP reductase n=1 Tax=Luteitalea sp. TBR-22 TaxID=2802971 RepID=UPI001AF6A56F|nr:3-ketoacyl-ACP reductase [Luteitalea sp. TBR-22]BCS31727.1 3-ketoacyl-ACP reductase [Luteitalea sp. TBR-22]
MPATSHRPVAIVTGAARGIGRACALALAAGGFDIVLADLVLDDPLRETCREVEGLGVEAAAIAIDVARIEQHEALVGAAVSRWGRLDCLVNNAGVGVRSRGDLLDVTPESFDRCLAVNTRAVFFLSQVAARHMLAQGEIAGQHRSIVNVTSSNAVAVSIARGEYCVSKAASSMTTQLFALRLADAGIGVYEVRPGIIATAMTQPVRAQYDEAIAGGLVPARRWGQPEDVASTVRAMAEGRLIYTVGQAVTVDGGLTVPRF